MPGHPVVPRLQPGGAHGRTTSMIALASVCDMSIEACGLTKRYGDKIAVDDLTFAVRPGMVTGFLGRMPASRGSIRRPTA